MTPKNPDLKKMIAEEIKNFKSMEDTMKRVKADRIEYRRRNALLIIFLGIFLAPILIGSAILLYIDPENDDSVLYCPIVVKDR